VRVFGINGKGNVLRVGGNGSILSYANFMRGGACFHPPVAVLLGRHAEPYSEFLP